MAEETKGIMQNTEEQNKAKGKVEKKIAYMIPLNVLSDDTHHTVIYKGKPYQIECGVEVMVPTYIAEILDNALKQRKAANLLSRELSTQHM